MKARWHPAIVPYRTRKLLEYKNRTGKHLKTNLMQKPEIKKCPYCGSPVAPDAKRCATCNSPIPEDAGIIESKTAAQSGRTRQKPASQEADYCKNCGNKLTEKEKEAFFCFHCGAMLGSGRKFCPFCGAATDPAAFICLKCGNKIALPDDNDARTADKSIYCRHCGKPLNESDTVCLHCGAPVGQGSNYCPHCGAKPDPLAVVCVKCGYALKEFPSQKHRQQYHPQRASYGEAAPKISMSDAIQTCMQKYSEATGRARRSEYWYFALFVGIVVTICGIIDALASEGAGVLEFIACAVLFLPYLMVNIRRLHDTGKSGWWTLIQLIPIAGWIVNLVFCCTDSQEGENQYGPNPKY